MQLLERIQLEKAAADHGFDITPVSDGEWLSFRSSQLPYQVWLRQNEMGYIVATDSTALLAELWREMPRYTGALPSGGTGALQVLNYSALYRALSRLAALSRSLPSQVAQRFVAATHTLPHTTEAERWVVQRVGQELFREALIDYWQGSCAVSGLSIVPLLRASHIKPWSECGSDEERLDVFNGLLLSPQLDALFDDGRISFEDSGTLMISPSLDAGSRRILGIHPDAHLSWVAHGHRSYLAYHRQHVFKPAGD